MLTRRHIRVKVMQSIYAFWKLQTDDLTPTEKFIKRSNDSMYDLYLLLLSLLVEIQKAAAKNLEQSQKKYLATEAEKNPNRAFVENRVLHRLMSDSLLQKQLEAYKIDHWQQDDEYVHLLLKEILESVWYQGYMAKSKTSFEEDQDLIVKLYRKVIAPNEKLYDYLEDKRLTWLDDFPVVNTIIAKTLKQMNSTSSSSFLLMNLYKDEEDEKFAIDLFRKTVLNRDQILEEIVAKTPNWDKDRIADIDMALLQMAIAEFLYFPSIPVKVTINEYLEIAKEYSTPKSSLFINGILDRLVKEYTDKGTLNKSGRGLL